MTPIPAGWKPISSAPKDGTPVLLFARHVDAEASTRVVGWFNAAYGWIAQSYIGQPVARLVPSQWAELLPFPGTPASVAPGDAQDERSPTHGMTLGERIAHVGGRTNAQGYTEFGSPMAVNALIQHVLRDIDWTRQDDDGGYQARYRLPGGQWSSWGHVVCGVKGHEQELRYLPGVRRAAPAAGDAREVDPLQGAANWLVQAHSQPCPTVLSACLMIGYNRAQRLYDAAIAAQQGKGGE